MGIPGNGIHYAAVRLNIQFIRGLVFMKSPQKVNEPQSKRILKLRTDLHLLQKNDFKDEVCQVYDLLIDTGIEPQEAIRKTRSALKAINYSFATYDVVMARLRASGRLRKHLHNKAGDGISKGIHQM